MAVTVSCFGFHFLACNSPALTWFFNQFDSNKDLVLDKNERAEFEINPDEHCMRKFFGKCDLNKDQNLSLNEICACFINVGEYLIYVSVLINSWMLGERRKMTPNDLQFSSLRHLNLQRSQNL